MRLVLINLFFIIASLKPSLSLDVLEKEILKKRPPNTPSSETMQSEQNKQSKKTQEKELPKIYPIPNFYFTDESSVQIYQEGVRGQNEEDLLKYLEENKQQAVPAFRKPKSDYLPPNTDKIRGFKVYAKTSKEGHKEENTNNNDDLSIPKKKESYTPKSILEKKEKE